MYNCNSNKSAIIRTIGLYNNIYYLILNKKIKIYYSSRASNWKEKNGNYHKRKRYTHFWVFDNFKVNYIWQGYTVLFLLSVILILPIINRYLLLTGN